MHGLYHGRLMDRVLAKLAYRALNKKQARRLLCWYDGAVPERITLADGELEGMGLLQHSRLSDAGTHVVEVAVAERNKGFV